MRLLPFLVAVLVSGLVLFLPASEQPPPFPGADKLVHLAVFAALAVTGRRGGLPAPQLAVGLVAYAAGSEVLQGLLPIARGADPADAAADVLGAALGLLLARRWQPAPQPRGPG